MSDVVMTDEPIIFKQVSLPGTMINIMNQQRMVKKRTRELLSLAFEHGGYIAGGFGAILARHFVLGEDADNVESFYLQVRQHLGAPTAHPPMPGQPEGSMRSNNVGSGDIDVWFPDEPSLAAFLNDPRRTNMLSMGVVLAKETITGTAIEHIIEHDARVQVIVRFLMPLEEQLSRFDIYNGMVGVTNDKIVFPEHWEVLERARILHVSTWKTPWTVNRFFKYLQRKGYMHVTPSTANAVLTEAFKTLDWFKAEGATMSKESMAAAIGKNKLLKQIALTPTNVQDYLRPIMGALPAERLLEISALFKAANYDRAMQEIHRRIPVR